MTFDWKNSRVVKHTIKEKNPRIFVCASGAGAGIQGLLWTPPGASAYLVGSVFPYESDQLDEFLGFKPTRYCAKETAIEMAIESYYRAFNTSEPNRNTIGLGVTAVVASTRTHSGGNRVFIAAINKTECRLYSYEFANEVGTNARSRDGAIVDKLAIYALANMCGVDSDQYYTGNVFANFEEYFLANEIDLDRFKTEDCSELAMELFLRHSYWDACDTKINTTQVFGDDVGVIFPGAFNPPHEGHFALAGEASLATDHNVLFAISVDNPHKANLTVGDALNRAKYLKGVRRVFTSGHALYVDKAKAWPDKFFIIGSDALDRMLDPKWGPTVEECLNDYMKFGIKFLVSDRIMNGKEEAKLLDLFDKHQLSFSQRKMFQKLYTQIDISSTELRNKVNVTNE